MARTQGSDDLYQLIHSLSTEEKGYFVKFAKRHSESGSQLLLLFQLISQQNTYDEKILKKKVKHLPVIKSLLFDQVLLSLYVSDVHLSSVKRIERDAAYAKILFQRGLKKKATKMTTDAYHLALENEFYPLALLLSKTLENIEINNIASANRWKKVSEYRTTDKELLQLLELDSALRYEERKLVTLTRLQNEEEISTKLKQIDLAVLQQPINLKRPATRMVSLNSLRMYYLLTGDLKNHYRYSVKYLRHQQEFYKKNPTQPRKTDLVIATINHLNTCLDCGQLIELKKQLNGLKALGYDHKGLNPAKQLMELFMQQELYFWSNKFEEGALFTEQAFAEHDMPTLGRHHVTAFAYILRSKALFYLLTGRLQQSYLALQDLRNIAKQLNDNNLQTDVLLTEIMVQQQLGHYDIALKLFASLSTLNSRHKILKDSTLKAIKKGCSGKPVNVEGEEYLAYIFPLAEWLTGAAKQLSLATLIAASNKLAVEKKYQLVMQK